METDIVIIGGGIAGLWLLNRLRQLNYSVILLESQALGGGQTHKAQGIIHGGMKFALQGVLTQATQAIADMPTVWRQCLQGQGQIDLSNVPVLSNQQYLWSTGSLTSKLAGFFAGHTLKGTVKALNKTEYPNAFQHPEFNGQVYSLDEVVIDTHALVRELVKPNREVIFKIDALKEEDVCFDESDRLTSLLVHAEPLEPLEIKAQKYIFTAGSGNEFLLTKLKNKITMQRRPLSMVMVKSDSLPTLYAHCLGLSAVPRITITTHHTHDGKTVWYLGGQIAEEGIKLDEATQNEIARKELQILFPWINFSNAEIKSFIIDRAEALQPDGKRPDSCYVKDVANTMIAWPTKLAFAPKLADEIIEHLSKEKITPQAHDTHLLRAWPIPAFAKPMWDQFL